MTTSYMAEFLLNTHSDINMPEINGWIPIGVLKKVLYKSESKIVGEFQFEPT